MNLLSIDLRKLRNAEFLQFVTNINSLIERNEPEELGVDSQYEVLKRKQLQLDELFKKEKVSMLTQELIELDERRDRAYSGVSTTVRAHLFHFKEDLNKAAQLLNTNLKLYGVGITQQNYQAETALLNNIIEDWETKIELREAVALLGLSNWLREMKEANALFDERYLMRTEQYGAIDPGTISEKREEVNKAYMELRKHLQAQLTIQNTELHKKTVGELNALVTQYNNLLSSRSGRTKEKPDNE